MNEKEFQKIYLPKIKKVLDFAIKNPYSDFYRKKYNGKVSPEKIKTYEDFLKIPFLEKDEILKTPLEKRTFVPKEKILHYAFTSGTTNAKEPLIIPHSYCGYDISPKVSMFNEKRLKKWGVKNFLVLFSPLSSLFWVLLNIPKKDVVHIPGDVKKLALTASLIKKVGIQGIVSTPTILYYFIEELDKIGFDKNSIKWIWIAAETCTLQRLEYFKSCFPNAKFEMRYGSAETSSGLVPRGYLCDYLFNGQPDIYHIFPEYLLEIIDKKNKPQEKESGEIIHTDLFFKQRAFPLIRYKTGDIGLIKKEKCKCGNDNFLKLGGRNSTDVLKFHGVTLYVQLIEDSLDSIREFLGPHFQMHVFEKSFGRKIMPQLILKLSLKENSNFSQIEKKAIDAVSEKLLLASGKNLKYFVENNIFLPLKVELIESWPKEDKPKKIISHLE